MKKKIKVKNLTKMGFSSYTINTKGEVFNIKTNKFMSTYQNNVGYVLCSMTNDEGKKKNRLVHLMVATMFIPNPDNLPDVGHKDDDKTNNNVSNLEWTSHSDNIKKTYKDPNRGK